MADSIHRIYASKSHTHNTILFGLLTDTGLRIKNPYPCLDVKGYNRLLSIKGFRLKYENHDLVLQKDESGNIDNHYKLSFDIDDLLYLQILKPDTVSFFINQYQDEDYERKKLVLRRIGIDFLQTEDESDTKSELKVNNPHKIKYTINSNNYHLSGFIAKASLLLGIESELLSKFNLADYLSCELYPLPIQLDNLADNKSEEDEFQRRLKRLKSVRKASKYHYRIKYNELEKIDQIALPYDSLINYYILICSLILSKDSPASVGFVPFESDKAFMKIINSMGIEASFKKSENSENIVEIKNINLIAKKIKEKYLRICPDAFAPLILLTCFIHGKSVIRGLPSASSLWQKRIKGIAEILSKSGARVGEIEDGLVVESPSEILKTDIKDYQDVYLNLCQYFMAYLYNQIPPSPENYYLSDHHPNLSTFLTSFPKSAKSLA